MSLQIRSAAVRLFFAAGIASLLSACATLPNDAATAPALNPAWESALPSASERRIQAAPLPVYDIAEMRFVPSPLDLTDDTGDLWQRIRFGFSMPDLGGDLVLYHQQWYLNRPDYLRRMVERSRRYLYHIVDELNKRNMPTELALLPMVESSFNPMAYSRAQASGLWQFIPATGKRYNLDQNWWKDERRDIVASTSAALDYLQSIYEMHGDWQLALASYNWGEGAVGRAIAKNQAQGLPTDYRSLTMPVETANYVPKLQALKNIFGNPKLVALLDLPPIPNRPYFTTLTKAADIDVKLAARLAEMPVQEFIALNPAHNRPVIKSESVVVIPADKFHIFVNNLEAHEGSKKPLSSWKTYALRPGDKLNKIAARFGMTLAHLKAVNGINGKRAPRPGTMLLVVGSGEADALDNTTLPQQARRSDLAEMPAAGQSHTVRQGETLSSIARRYGTSIAELKRTNRLHSDKLAAGRTLQIAAPGKTAMTVKSDPSSKTEGKTSNARNTAAGRPQQNASYADAKRKK